MQKNKVQLISNTEKFQIQLKEFSDSTFYYRRITTTAHQSIVRNNLSKGLFDNDGAVNEMLEKYVTGWKGIVDQTGKEISFDPTALKFLPDEAQAELGDAIRGQGRSNGEAIVDKEKK